MQLSHVFLDECLTHGVLNVVLLAFQDVLMFQVKFGSCLVRGLHVIIFKLLEEILMEFGWVSCGEVVGGASLFKVTLQFLVILSISMHVLTGD